MIKTGVQIKWFSKLVTSYQMIPLMDDKISQIIPLRDQFPAPKYILRPSIHSMLLLLYLIKYKKNLLSGCVHFNSKLDVTNTKIVEDDEVAKITTSLLLLLEFKAL